MGTSASSSGPGSDVLLVPPWVSDPDIIAPTPSTDDQDVEQGSEDEAHVPDQMPSRLAPSRRFMGARNNLGRYGSSGFTDSLGRGLGRYVQPGLGGSRRASQRMAGTARKAGALYGVLDALSTGTTPAVDLGIDTARLAGQPARVTVDRIAEALSPSDGTQDSEASRYSISQALCELVKNDPTADLASLTQEQIELAVELFISADICRRIELDVGKAILQRAPSPATAIRRLEEMYRYVRQVVAAVFRRRIVKLRRLSQQTAIRVASRVIRETFEVFESYLS